MLTLEELAVALAYELESYKRNTQIAAENQKRTIKELRASRHDVTLKLQAAEAEIRSLRGKVKQADPEAQSLRDKNAVLTNRAGQLEAKLIAKNREITATAELTERVRILTSERDSYSILYRDCREEVDKLRHKLRLALGAMEDAREMVHG